MNRGRGRRPVMRALATVAVLLLLPLAGCSAPATERADVVASFYPLEFLARRIGGEDATVSTIVEAGVEPHDYEPTPSDVVAVAGAKVVLLQGAGFEGWLDTVKEKAPDATYVVTTDGIDLREGGDAHAEEEGHEEEEEADHEEDGAPRDPHTWLDPVLFADQARAVEAALATAMPEHAIAFRARADALVAELDALDREYEAGLADCDLRVIVTAHSAFGYMAERYRFEMVAVSLDPEAEPTPDRLRDVVDEVRERNVTIVYFEELVSPKVAEAIARETGAATRVLSPIEGIPPEETGADYMSKMRDDLVGLREGMRCR